MQALISNAIAIAILTGVAGAAYADSPAIYQDGNTAILQNEQVALQFDLDKGHYDVINSRTGEIYLHQAVVSCNDYASNDPGRKHHWSISTKELGPLAGEWLTITSTTADAPALLFQAAFMPGTDALALRAGVENTHAEPLQLTRIAVIDDGTGFPGQALSENFAMLDGRGGGVNTSIVISEYLRSLNNMLVTFGDGDARRSMVMGGLTYDEFEKLVEIGEYRTRKELITGTVGPEAEALLYLNLGEEEEAEDDEGIRLILDIGEPFRFSAPIPDEFTRIAFDPDELVVRAEGLDPARTYELGFTWFDANPIRTQNIVVDGGADTPEVVLAEAQPVPAMVTRGWPEEFRYYPEPELYETGQLRLRIQRSEGPNAILSEVWLREVDERKPLARGDIALETGAAPETLAVHLYAEDPVGRRIDPGMAYLPHDYFYLDVMTPDPFDALEQYGLAVRDAQEIKLAMYTFPSVCLWYAQHPSFGGGPAINDSPGAVAEMQRVVESGFLRYSPVAIRLVPDNYGVNNQQGWWDDKRWQMYGSGVNPYNIVVEGGHLKEPYETTRKWGSEVRYLGGLPLMYVQTGVASKDFAETFPEWMLRMDDSDYDDDYTHPDLMDRRIDFTHPGFLKHYEGVFDNLRSGGIEGLMYDYPNTGWHDEGGFYDPYSTSAKAYRNIFAWAKKGLGPHSYVHERDLNRGSDVSRGVTDSERIWGDTDVMTPEMVARGSLRWYKNRVIINYDMDSKNLARAQDAGGVDAMRAVVTMSYVVSGRFLLGNSFARFTPEMVHALSRAFPYHTTPQSARPVNAFKQRFPSVFQYVVSPDWHQVTLHNASDEEMGLDVPMATANVDGGLALDPEARYYAYDFWNDYLVGAFDGSSSIRQTLRPYEARMLSMRRVLDRPQVLGTDRHIMQGYLELDQVEWNPDTQALTGVAHCVEDEPMTIIIAANGMEPVEVLADDAEARFTVVETEETDLVRLVCSTEHGGPVRWTLRFRES